MFHTKQFKKDWFHMKQGKIRDLFYKFAYDKWISVLTLCWVVFLFFLPIQTRLVSLTQYSYINKNFVFYNTMFLNITDIVILIIAILWVFGLLFGKFHVKQSFKIGILGVISLYFVAAALSIAVSYETNNEILIYGLFKLFLSILLICFTINIIAVKQLFHTSFLAIISASILQSIIGVSQYFLQKSVGLKLFGEEYITPYLGGIAKFKIEGGYRWVLDKILSVSHETDLVMRPYGTFPHPNVFGAFLVFGLSLTSYMFFVSRETWKRYLLGLFVLPQTFTLFMTFSRTAVFGWLFICLIFIIVSKYKKIFQAKEEKRTQKMLVAIWICSALLSLLLFYPQYLERSGVVSYGTTNEQSVSERVLYQQIAWNMIRSHPLIGVGYQNFVLEMDHYTPRELKDSEHQPVHNIYLLVAAETGVFGLAFFVLFFGLLLLQTWKTSWTILTAFLFSLLSGLLIMGLFDHYLLTIQQGRLVLFLCAGFLWADVLIKKSPERGKVKSDDAATGHVTP